MALAAGGMKGPCAEALVVAVVAVVGRGGCGDGTRRRGAEEELMEREDEGSGGLLSGMAGSTVRSTRAPVAVGNVCVRCEKGCRRVEVVWKSIS